MLGRLVTGVCVAVLIGSCSTSDTTESTVTTTVAETTTTTLERTTTTGPIGVPDPDLSPVVWTIELDDLGEGIYTIFTTADVRPVPYGVVDDLSGRLVWDETVVDLCGVQIRYIGDGYIHIGDVHETTEGCGTNPTAMQDAFDNFGLPEAACVGITTDRRTYEYCAPLPEI